MRFTNLTLWVQDATLSVKFYKKLGFDIVHVTDRDASAKLESLVIMLVTMRDDEEFATDALNGQKGKGMYMYIQTEDVDAKYRELAAKGIVARNEPRNWEWGNREFVVSDPDGYKICFWTKSTK